MINDVIMKSTRPDEISHYTSGNNVKIQHKRKLVVFYSNTARAFRTALIGHLFEISQVYDVILLSEELDQETSQLINDKSYFPHIKRIIQVNQYSKTKKNLFFKNKKLCRLAKNTILQYNPDMVFASSDWHSLFEMYLMRFAKRNNTLRITLQDTYTFETATSGMWIDLIVAYSKFPDILPLRFRLILVRLRKYLGHFLYYWILPSLNFEYPFFGQSSYILHKGHSGSRDSNFHIVFNESDYEKYKNSGVPSEKLHILPHPVTRKPRIIFTKLFQGFNQNDCKNILVVLLPAEEIGFKRVDYTLIEREERNRLQDEVLLKLSLIFKKWQIIVKPHPLIKNYINKKKHIESISPYIQVVDPKDSAEKYVGMAKFIIELPRAASTVLHYSLLMYPEKPIIALDLHHEFVGDCYKGVKGVNYVSNMDNFVILLQKIRRDNYIKQLSITEREGHLSEENCYLHYSNLVELLQYLEQVKAI